MRWPRVNCEAHVVVYCRVVEAGLESLRFGAGRTERLDVCARRGGRAAWLDVALRTLEVRVRGLRVHVAVEGCGDSDMRGASGDGRE